jgi:hypothetical protein
MRRTIFVSAPTGLSAGQHLMSWQWHQRLDGLGFRAVQLTRDEYRRDPWPLLRHLVDAADGMLVLGFRQLRIEAAEWRRDTNEHSDVSGATWTSPWLHVETGMALASGMPVLVAAEAGVREGVFAAEVWTGPLSGTTLEQPCPAVVGRWASMISSRALCKRAS